MTNSNNFSPNKPPKHSKDNLASNLLLDNPLIAIGGNEENFRLDTESFNVLQNLRNQIAIQKLEFQVDLDDPNYSLKTLRLLAYFDAKLEICAELMALHLTNTTHTPE